MSRYDVTIVFTQEFSFAIEAESANAAQNIATEQMQAGAAEAPERIDMKTTVTKGVN